MFFRKSDVIYCFILSGFMGVLNVKVGSVCKCFIIADMTWKALDGDGKIFTYIYKLFTQFHSCRQNRVPLKPDCLLHIKT